MKNLFSFKLYLEGLRKIKLLGFSCAAVVILLNALGPLVCLADRSSAFLQGTKIVSMSEYAIVLPMIILFTPFFVYSMFSFLTKRNESDFFHAIPYKRTTVCISFLAALYTWLWGILLAALLVNGVLWSLCPMTSFSVSIVPKLFGILVFATLYAGGFSLLAVTLTGTRISSYAVTLIFACLFRIVTFCFSNQLETMLPIFDLSYSPLRFLSLRYWFPATLICSYFGSFSILRDATLWIFSSAVVLATHLLGLHFYRTRKSEIATQSAPSRILQHIYRCAFALPFALLALLAILNHEDFSLFLVFAILTLLVYFLYELITTKSLSSTIRCTPFLGALLAVCLLFTGGLFAIRGIVLNESPDAAGIKAVNLYNSSPFVDFFEGAASNSYEDLMTKDLKVHDSQAFSLVSSAWNRTLQNNGHLYWRDNYRNQSIAIQKKNGKTIGRQLAFTESEYEELQKILLESPEYQDKIIRMPQASNLADLNLESEHDILSQTSGIYKTEEVWNVFLAEYNKMTDTEKQRYKTNVFDGELSGYFLSGSGFNGTEAFEIYYPVPQSFTKTVSFLDRLFDSYRAECREKVLRFVERQAGAPQADLEINGTLSLLTADGERIEKYFSCYYYDENRQAVKLLVDWLSAREENTGKEKDLEQPVSITLYSYQNGQNYSYRFTLKELSADERAELKALVTACNGYWEDINLL